MSLYSTQSNNQNKNKRKSIINLDDLKQSRQKNIQSQNKQVKPNPQQNSENNSELMDSELQKLLQTNVVELLKQSKQFQFGNYNSYYSTRFERKWQDPRMNVFTKENILNKEVLDIGCNDGSLTLQLAIKYFPKKIIGVDIDYHMVNKAIENMNFLKENQKSKQNVQNLNQIKQQQQNIFSNNQDILYKQNTFNTKIEQNYETDEIPKQEEIEEQNTSEKLLEKLSKLPKCFIKKDVLQKAIDKKMLQEKQEQLQLTNQNNQNQQQQNNQNNLKNQLEQVKPQKSHLKVIIHNKFPENILFRMENYIEDLTISEKFDTILCFSMTKWIHLNFGDIGLKRLFTKMYKQLKINGLLFLEPQDWKSYKKKKNLCETFQNNFLNIKLRPDKFQEYLENELGFKLIRCFKNGKNIQIQQQQQENQQQLQENQQQQQQQNLNQQQQQENLIQQQQEDLNTPQGFKRPVYIYQKIK